MTQAVRRSQFVLSLGPGAIFESRSGPRIIPLPDIGVFNYPDLSPEDFEIQVPEMSWLSGKKIFYLPSNAELKKKEGSPIYKTKPFPSWALCRTHWILYRKRNGCPLCPLDNRTNEEAIRFIRACCNGHMDDVDWDYIVHEGVDCDADGGYSWFGGGGELKKIEIKCRKCSRKINFGTIYSREWKCSGRYPEREQLRGQPERNSGCDQPSRIIQRQASNLRIPEIISCFTIPPCYTTLHNLLQISYIHGLIAGSRPTNIGLMKQGLNRLLNGNLISNATVQEILRYKWEEIDNAIEDVITPVSCDSYAGLIRNEFYALVNSSINGSPPVKRQRPEAPVLFEVDSSSVRKCKAGNFRFRVTPIKKLNTTIVQRGYRRIVQTKDHIIDPTKCQPVDVSFSKNRTQWLPGVKFLGEGIFVMLDENKGYTDLSLHKEYDKWMNCYSSHRKDYKDFFFRDPKGKEELHPVFVWWHTIAHMLIRVLGIDSGYSSASIRERIYFENASEGAKGGIILYSVQPGGDGALGGLISMVPSFENILQKCFEMAESCPNDPLCEEQTMSFKPGRSHNGAACYGCLLISETSCEHRNMWLDRSLLKI